MTVNASRLCHVNSSSSKLASVKVERDELRVRLLELEGEKRSFEEHYNVLEREKDSLEDQVATLDRLVERLSHRIEVLVEEKKVLEVQVERSHKRLDEVVAEENLGWLIQKGVVLVVDKVVKSAEFALGVMQMKTKCVAASMENAK